MGANLIDQLAPKGGVGPFLSHGKPTRLQGLANACVAGVFLTEADVAHAGGD